MSLVPHLNLIKSELFVLERHPKKLTHFIQKRLKYLILKRR